MGRKTITVSEDTYEMLDRNKPDGVTWDKHLTDLQYATDVEEGGVGDLRPYGGEVPGKPPDVHELPEATADRIKRHLRGIETRVGDIERALGNDNE